MNIIVTRAVELTRVKELIAIKKINAVKIFDAWQNIVHIGNITVYQKSPENRQNQTLLCYQTIVYCLVSNYGTMTVFHKLKLS